LDPELNKDSFEAFGEALKVLVDNEADLILHAGDFYDRTDPPPWVQDKATSILRSTVTGRKSDLQVLEGKVNFEAEDVNIAVPLFLIHGTHDRPVGKPEAGPPFQHIVAAGYANYIDIDPENKFASRRILVEKDGIKLSIMGVGHRPEGYINASIAKSGIPCEGEATNIACVHNAVEGVMKTEGEYLDLTPFDGVDYVVIGHAHSARLDDDENLQIKQWRRAQKTRTIIPGATNITGLYPQDEGFKYAHLLEIHQTHRVAKVRSFRLTKARRVFHRNVVADGLTVKELKNELMGILDSLPLDETDKKPLVRIFVTGKLSAGSKQSDLKLDEIAAKYRDKVYNWSEMLIMSDLYGEDELKRLEDLKGAIEGRSTLSSPFERFCQKLKSLGFPAKYLSPDEVYHLFYDVKSTSTARRRIEQKLNKVLGIEPD
jgi:DNA repair exonuclease SbcCD nuclease subunit